MRNKDKQQLTLQVGYERETWKGELEFDGDLRSTHIYADETKLLEVVKVLDFKYWAITDSEDTFAREPIWASEAYLKYEVDRKKALEDGHKARYAAAEKLNSEPNKVILFRQYLKYGDDRKLLLVEMTKGKAEYRKSYSQRLQVDIDVNVYWDNKKLNYFSFSHYFTSDNKFQKQRFIDREDYQFGGVEWAGVVSNHVREIYQAMNRQRSHWNR